MEVKNFTNDAEPVYWKISTAPKLYPTIKYKEFTLNLATVAYGNYIAVETGDGFVKVKFKKFNWLLLFEFKN